jgi:hypothetical protein
MLSEISEGRRVKLPSKITGQGTCPYMHSEGLLGNMRFLLGQCASMKMLSSYTSCTKS